MEAVLEDAAIKEMDDCIEYAFIFGGEDLLMQLLHRTLISSFPIDFQHSTLKTTALMVAARHDHVLMIDTLVMHGADATLQIKDGSTALDLARRNGAAFAVAYLESLQEMEIPEYVGRGVMRLWKRSLMGPRPYHDDFNGRGMRPFGFMGNM